MKAMGAAYLSRATKGRGLLRQGGGYGKVEREQKLGCRELQELMC